MCRSPAPYLFGNRCDCRLCRWGVYRQRKNSKAPRMADAGRCLPFCAEKCGAGQRKRGQDPAGAVRGSNTAYFQCRCQGGQNQPTQTLHRGYQSAPSFNGFQWSIISMASKNRLRFFSSPCSCQNRGRSAFSPWAYMLRSFSQRASSLR